METKLEEKTPAGHDRNIAHQPKDHIPGWGYDANPDNDPTYPIKHRNGADHERMNYERAPQQHSDVEMFKSVERPALSRVYGTSTPPSGLSGAIKRWAYRYSENQSVHWMTLLLADRVNVVEGFIEDISRGIIPNIFAEKGLDAEWKHNRPALIKKLAVNALIVTAVIALFNRKKISRKMRLVH